MRECVISTQRILLTNNECIWNERNQRDSDSILHDRHAAMMRSAYTIKKSYILYIDTMRNIIRCMRMRTSMCVCVYVYGLYTEQIWLRALYHRRHGVL